MNEFLRYFHGIVGVFPMHLEIYYSRTMDWCVNVWKKSCADMYPGCERNSDGDAILVRVQDCTPESAGEEALKSLKKWIRQYTRFRPEDWEG